MMSYRVQASPLMWGLFLLFFLVFCYLSVWQVNRVYEKQAIAARIELAQQQQQVDVLALDKTNPLEYEFYSASATGTLNSADCFYVENVIKDGKPGLYLYCPMQLQNSDQMVLLNLGWLERPPERFDLPAIRLGSPDELLTVQGVVKRPRSTPVVVNSDGRPNIELDYLWAYFDFAYLNRQWGQRLLGIELQVTSDVSPKLLREWSGYDPKIGMHIGYAIHWAVFALVTLGLFLKFNLKKNG